MKCNKCGRNKQWTFFGRDGKFKVCDCEVDLDGGMLMPRGMFPSLDEKMDWMSEILKSSEEE
jgi:hypothetical protein